MGCHSFLQGIFLAQGLKPNLWNLLHWQVDSLPLSHLESPLYQVITGTFLRELEDKNRQRDRAQGTEREAGRQSLQSQVPRFSTSAFQEPGPKLTAKRERDGKSLPSRHTHFLGKQATSD